MASVSARRGQDVTTRQRASLAAAVAVGIFLAIVAFVLAPNLYPEAQSAATESGRIAQEAARLAAITSTRTSILALLAGAGAIVTIAINYRNSSISAETFRISERGNLIDRYSTAIELLGRTDSEEVRIGGIYALGAFATDSPLASDQLTVVEVLSAFVRRRLDEHKETRSGKKVQSAPAQRVGRTRVARGVRSPSHVSYHVDAPPDVLAAVSVLAQLPDRVEFRAIFLKDGLFRGASIRDARITGGNLRGSHLWAATFQYSSFRQSNFSNCVLAYADLQGVDFSEANLVGSSLHHASFRQSNLTQARLSESKVWDANFYLADCTGCQLESIEGAGAQFCSANLTAANFRSARLFNASLSFAQLDGADLTSADLLMADLSYAQFGQADVKGARFFSSGVPSEYKHRAKADGVVEANMQWAEMSEVINLKASQLTLRQAQSVKSLPSSLMPIHRQEWGSVEPRQYDTLCNRLE